MHQLMDYFREKHLLLVLDNCEHLIQACAQIVSTLLRNHSTLKILATSREALGISGEMVWYVPSLSLPDVRKLPSIEKMSQYEAVQLFIERATLVQPHFFVTRGNAPAIAQICFRLDGIPLAIELAAARVRALDVEQISKRLDDRFRLLTGGSRTALERHQTLRATIDWSHNLLSVDEKILFRRLSVFAGGWVLEAAEHVCGQEGEFDILDLLTRLVDKSLVILDGSRYRMLETTRQYAREKLVESEDSRVLHDQHLAYFFGFAEQADKKLRGPEEVEWMDRLELDHDNFRTALAWCESEQNIESLMRLLVALSSAWGHREHFSEIRGWFERIRALPQSHNYPALYARLLNSMGQDSYLSGDFRDTRAFLEESQAIWLKLGIDGERGLAEALECLGNMTLFHEEDIPTAQSFFEKSFELYRKHGDEWGMATVIFDLGSLAFVQGHDAQVEEHYLTSLVKFQKLGDKGRIALVLSGLGELARFLGDYERAGKFWEQNLESFRALGDRYALAWPFQGLAWVALHEGDSRKAKALFEESLQVSNEMNNKRLMILCLMGFASILGMTGKPKEAAQLFGAVEFLSESINHMEPADQKDFNHYVTVVRGQLDEAAFAKAWGEGRLMTMEQAIEFELKEYDE
jgi:non-specific serine/threonine protein kinase